MPGEIDQLLPPNASLLERALEQAAGVRLEALDVGAIARAQDPQLCPVELLPFLAFSRGVDLWSDAWPEWRKRDVIARSFLDHRLKGTEAGARRYVEIAGGTLVETLTPPQGVFAGPSLSDAQRDAYVARHPKVRITLAHGEADRKEPLGTYAAATFACYDFVDIDQGPELYGRRAYLVEDGEARPIRLVGLGDGNYGVASATAESIVLPGEDAGAIYAGASFAGMGFADAIAVEPLTFSYSLNRDDMTAGGTTVPLGFEPMDSRWFRESEEGYDPDGIYAGASFANVHFVTEDIAKQLLADVLHLHDPSIAAPFLQGFSFAGVSRVGMEPHTAELLIDIDDVAKPHESYAGANFANHNFLGPDDPRHRDLLLESVAVSKRASDRIGVRFDTLRPRTLDDGYPLDGSFKFGGLVANHL